VYLVYEQFVSFVALLSHHLFVLSLLKYVWTSYSSYLFYSCKALVDNTYPKGYTSNNKGGVVIELEAIFYATEKFVEHISIEHLSHVLLFTTNFPLKD
jgi:hypothetical protein